MTISVLKIAPTAVVVIVSGVCIWPYLWGSEEDAAGPKPATPPVLSAALLDPAVGTNFERNPFLETAAVRMALARIVYGRIKDKVVASFKKRASAGDEVKVNVKGKGKVVRKEGPDLTTEIVLNGTYLHPDRQLAMINGRVYAIGEALKGIDADMGRHVLEEVHPHSVVITVRGKRQEISYPALTSRPRELAAKGQNVLTTGQDGIGNPSPRRPSQRKPMAKAAGAGPGRTKGRGR